MRRLKSLILVSLATLLLVGQPTLVAAGSFDQVCNSGSGAGDSTLCQEKDNSDNPVFGARGIISKAITLVAIAVGVISVFMIMIAGFRFITSSGDPNTVTGARNTVLYAVIGLAVAILAQTIVVFVINKL